MAGLTKHLGLIGTGLEVGGTIAAGRAADAGGRFRAKQLKRQGVAELAAASRQAEEIGRQTEFATSRARALSAASGGGVATDVIGQLAGEGEYRALTALWEGQDRRAGLDVAADAAKISGREARKGSLYKAAGSFIDAAPSLWEKYGDDWEAFRGASS